MILKGKQYKSYLSSELFFRPVPPPKEIAPDPEEARLCAGALGVKDAFQDVMKAIAAESCPPKSAPPSKARRPRTSPRSNMVPAEEVRLAPPRKWEIDAALDFVFSGLETPPARATAEEIAATLDNALPEEAGPPPLRSSPPRAAEVFVIPYDFELKCLLSAGQGQANPRWVPASFLRSAPGQEEKKN